MKAYIEKILLPYVRDKRKELKLTADCPELVIFDKFTGQGTEQPAIVGGAVLEQPSAKIRPRNL